MMRMMTHGTGLKMLPRPSPRSGLCGPRTSPSWARNMVRSPRQPTATGRGTPTCTRTSRRHHRRSRSRSPRRRPRCKRPFNSYSRSVRGMMQRPACSRTRNGSSRGCALCDLARRKGRSGRRPRSSHHCRNLNHREEGGRRRRTTRGPTREEKCPNAEELTLPDRETNREIREDKSGTRDNPTISIQGMEDLGTRRKYALPVMRSTPRNTRGKRPRRFAWTRWICGRTTTTAPWVRRTSAPTSRTPGPP